MFERISKSGFHRDWSFSPVTRLEGKRSVAGRLRSETAVQPVGRIRFEALEQRVLLSADINPAFGAFAVDPGLQAHLAVQEVGASYTVAIEEAEVDLAATAVPSGPAPHLAAFDLTVLDKDGDFPGSRVHSFTNSLYLDDFTTTDSFTGDLQAGQVLSLTRSDDGDLASIITLLDPNGSEIASLLEADQVVNGIQITEAGTYTVVVDRLSGAGYATVVSVLNAVLEEEDLGGAGNDSVAEAQSLDASAVTSQNGGVQYSAIGDATGYQTDVFSFAVTPGDIVSVWIETRSGNYNLNNVRVLDENSTLVTDTSFSASYSDAHFTGNILVRDGTERLFVEVSGYDEYNLVVTTDITPGADYRGRGYGSLDATGFGQGHIGEGGGYYSNNGSSETSLASALLEPLSIEPDDTIAEATFVYLPNTRYAETYEYGEILNDDVYGDQDVYAVDLVEGDYFNIQAYSYEGLEPVLKLFDEFGTEITWDYSSYSGGYYYGIYGYASYTGTFYTVVTGAGNENYDPTLPYSGDAGSEGYYDLYVYTERYNFLPSTTYFSLTVVQGDEITLTTLTPDDPSGLPDELPDPVIEFESDWFHDGTLVVTDAGDGRNDIYSFTAQYSGELRFSVHSNNGAGTVQVIAEGSTAEALTAPVFNGSSLPEGGTTRFVNDTVTMYFDQQIYGPDVDGFDLLVNGVAANSGYASGSQIYFDIAGLIEDDGVYTFELVANGLTSLEGGVFGGASFTVTYDTIGAAVESSAPGNGAVVDPGMTTIALTFTENVNAFSITPSTFNLSEINGGTVPAIASVTRIDDRNVILNLSDPLAEGAFQLDFQTTYYALQDRAGNSFTTQSIGFVVDSADIALDDLMLRIGSPGLGSFGAELTGTLFDAADVDTYTFSVEAGQAVVVLVNSTGAADVAVRLVDEGGTEIWAGTAASLGAAAVFGPDSTLVAGNYAIEIAGITGESAYTLLFMLNTDIEDESNGGASNDDTDTAQAPEILRAIGGGQTTTVVGTLNSDNGDAADVFAITLAAGERLDVVGGSFGGTVEIALLSPTGDVITIGAVTEDGSASIGNFVAPAAGTYFLRVTTAEVGTTRYQLGLSVGIALQIPLDNRGFDASGLSSLIGGLGGQRGFGGNARIAVVGVAGSEPQFQTLVNQLNDSTVYSFDASLVYGVDVDTRAELDDYDLVILANTGQGQNRDGIGFVAGLLPDWVASGGGVIMTGWGVYGSGDETSAARTALEQVLPVRLSGSYNYYFGSTTVFDATHPVTEGLTTILSPYVEFPRSGLTLGATALGGSQSTPTIAVREVGLGRSVYLGPIYASNQSTYGFSNTGAVDQLIEQAAAWAGGNGRRGQLSLDAVAGQEITLETFTPGEDPGLPLNDGDLRLRIYAPDGSLVAENLNGAADGRNALVSYTIPDGADGSYTIEIRRESGRSDIDYLLTLDGNTQDVGPLMMVVETVPDDGQPMQTGVNVIDINFSQSVDLGTLDVSDLVLDGGGTVESVTLLDGDTVRFTLAFPEGDKSYAWSMAADAVRSISGTALEASSGSFIVDETPPWVSSTTPETNIGAPFQALTFVFDEEVDPTSVSTADITQFIRPDGTSILSSISSIEVNGAEVTVRFSAQYQAGSYRMTIGPNVLDMSGNPMQSPDGTQQQFTAIIQVESPDLQVTNVNVPENVRFGEAFNVTYTVTNTGDDPASANWYDRIYLANSSGSLLRSLSTPFRASVDDLGNLLPPLQPGASYTQTVSVTLPINDNNGEGTFRIVVDADIYGYQNESNNGNNSRFASTNVTYPPLVDLVVEPFPVPQNAISGQQLPITWTVTNAGDANFDGTFYDRVYLSNNGTNLSVYLGQFVFTGPIAAGESVTRVQTVTLPDTLDGEWFLRVETDSFGYVAEGPGESNNRTSSSNRLDITLREFPNLVVTAVETPDLAFSSAPITVEWTVQNIGEAATNAPIWYDHVYLSLDDVFGNDDDTYLGQVANPSFLNADGSYRNSLTATLPRGIEGPYFINVRTDVYDQVEEFTNEGDNGASSAVFDVSLTPPPDLQVTNVIAPIQAFSGALTSLTYTVSNEGDGRTLETAWHDQVWMSLDDVIDADDFYLGLFYRAGRLEAGASYDNTVSVRLPVGISGDYLFLVKTDVYDGVYENVYEDNNVGFDRTPLGEPDFTQVTLTPPPDLEIVLLDQPDPFYSGRAQTLTYEVANIGATATLNSYRLDQVWLSDDDILDNSDILVGQAYRYGTLQSGAFLEHEISVTLPDGTLGDRTLILVTDADNREFEIDRTNNRTTTTVDARILAADLAVTGFSASSAAESGGAFIAGWTVTNRGEGNTVSASWSDRIVISRDNIFGNSDDRVLQSVADNVGTPLAPGASYAQSGIVIQVPFDLEGQYFLFLQTDGADQVFENGRNSNNVSAPQAITIIRNAPDLVASDVSFAGPEAGSPDTVTAGRNLSVRYTVTNEGPGKTEATYWYDGIYLSANDTLDPAEDILIGRHYRTNRLATDQAYTVDTTVFVPIALPAGDYRVIVKADLYGAVDEEDADVGNNVAASAAVLAVSAFENGVIDPPPDGSDPYAGLTPDLVVESVTASASGFSGQLITVNWTVKNEGPQVTGPRSWYDTVYLSLDQNLDTGSDIRIGYVYHNGGLEVDETYDVSGSFLVPGGVAGEWFVFVRTDAGSSIGEVDETNNNGLTASPTSLVLPPPSDLVAGVISVPETGIVGAPVTFSYTVTNEGANAVQGRWIDSIYLSADGVWDIEDELITTVDRFGPVAAGASYTAEVTAALPGVLPGNYKIIVRSDIRNAVPEADEDNNEAASEDSLAADAQVLEIGTEANGMIGGGQSIFYKITLPEDETIRLTLDREGDGATEVYASFSRVPSRSSFDASARAPFQTDQVLLIPSSAAGEYYVMIFGQSGPSTAFTILAETVPFSLTEADPTAIGNSGLATLEIDGARFSEDTLFDLIGTNGEVVAAFDVIVENSTRAYARFAMAGVTPGSYDLRATRGGLVVELTDAILVDAALGTANMLVNITGPATVRPDRVNTFQVNFANTGGADTRAPLILVTSSGNLAMGLSGDRLQRGGLQILGSDLGGPVDVFRPGAESVASVVYRTESSDAGVGMTARAITTSDVTQIDDFAAIELQIRPTDLSNEDWNAFWLRIQPRIGTTWGQYVGFINDVATYVEEATGETTRDVRELMSKLHAVNPDYLPSVAIAGQLIDSLTGTGVSGVTLLAYEATDIGFNLREVTQSGNDGVFRFGALQPGTYRIELAGPEVDGVLTNASYGFDLDEDRLVDEGVVLAEVPEDQDISGLSLKVIALPSEAALRQARDPKLATGSDGKLHMVWSQDGTMLHSVNDGSGWSTPIAIMAAIDARNVELHVRPGVNAGEDALLLVWMTGELNASQVRFAVAEQLSDGGYRWSSSEVLTEDAKLYGEYAVGIDTNGEAVFLFTKRDADFSNVDSDIYTKTLRNDDLILPMSFELKIQDIDLFQAYIDSFSEEELEELITIRRRFGIEFGGKIQVRGDATLQADTKKASLALNAALRWGFDIGKAKAEIEGSAGGEFGWKFDDKGDCSWDFDFGTLRLSGTGGINYPIDQLIGSLIPSGPAIVLAYKLFGWEISARGEGQLSGKWTYTEWDQSLTNPTSVEGSGRLSFGINAERAKSWWNDHQLTVRGLVNFNFDLSARPLGAKLSENGVSGSLLFRKTYDLSPAEVFAGKKAFVDTTYTWPSSGGSPLHIGGSTFADYTLVNLSLGTITTQPPGEMEPGDFVQELIFDEGISGSLLDLSGFGESAVTSNLTDEGMPVVAQAADGSLTGAWLSSEGIVVSDFESSTQNWSAPTLAVDYDSYDVRDLSVSYDGDGDILMMWNRLDLSGIEEGMTLEAFNNVVEAGGDLVFSSYDSELGEWSDQSALHALPGAERGITTRLLASGDVLATWVYQSDPASLHGLVYAAFWDAISNTWSTPTVIGDVDISEAPEISELNGNPIVVWSKAVEVAGTLETGFALHMTEFFEGSWREVEVNLELSGLEMEDAQDRLTQEALWNVEADLPKPDQEDCECEDGDCDDEDEDEYDPPVQRPSDPNDILGPVGFGEENWITTADPLGFKIRFENEPTATAPAQVVVITQQFDTDLNINSFRVDDFGWGDLIFEVDATSPFFTERYDFTDTHGFLVDVAASVDVTTRIATWTISTIDPETGEPPLDADAGFLPINDETGRGEGFVTYIISAARRVETGARVDSEARIVFDTELPIDTPPIFHTLDAVAPTSAVNALAERQDETDVLVSWVAEDDEGGSAIGGVSVFVSTNGGDWTVWLEDTTLTEAVWEGEVGNTYGFYSIARDNAGWVEDAPDVADASIAIGQQPGAIAGIVFNDIDGDGVIDVGEGGLANLIVYLDVDGSGDFDEADIAVLSDETGAYSFDGLQPGTYTVGAIIPEGLILTGEVGAITPVDVLADTTSAGPDFGIFAPGTVSGSVFRDGLGAQDGVRDGSEPGLAGWRVFVDADDNGLRDIGEASVLTDTSGRFSFTGLGAGTILLRVEAQDGYRQTAPTDDMIEIAVTSGLNATGLLFGFKPDAATISGTKFEDVNGNGQQDEGEAGLAGWAIFIDTNGDGELNEGEQSTLTDASGAYTLTNLSPGTYIVAEVPQDGWVQTFPGAEPFTVNGTTITTSSVQVALDLPAPVLAADPGLLTAQGADWADDLTGLSAFRAQERFADITGSRTTVVTIDSGIDLDHGFFGPDLDRDGRSDRIVFSYDFADRDANASDVTGHGTGVAGIIAGNHAQYGGLAPDADLISLKVFTDTGAGYFADLERALQWVILNGEDYGVSVVNMSIGDGGNWSEALGRYGLGDELAALADMDIIVIAASGNSYASFDTEGVAYPAADPSVIGVGAVWAGDYGGPWYFSNGAADYTTDADRITAFTQRDRDLLDVLAPGARFVTAGRDGGLATVQGTSHAAAYMSGVATLAQDLAIREFGHRLSAAEFSALLSQTATFVVDGDDEHDSVRNTGLSFPRVDMTALANAILAFRPGATDDPDGSSDDTGGDGPELVASAGQYAVTVAPGENVSGIDFGSFEQVLLSGTVFDDDSMDGELDPGEAGVEGIVVYLDLDEDGTLSEGDRSTTTDASGLWSLSGVGPGTETVRMIAPEGVSATRAEAQVETRSGTDIGGINFGLDIESDPVAQLTVAEVTTTRDGFVVRFSEAIDTTQISVNGPLSDVVLRNHAGEIVRGSLVFDADGQGFRFVATGTALTATEYTLTLRSGANGFAGVSGVLDGDEDGTAGGDFTTRLTGSPTDLPVLSIADFARAAGQSLAQGSAAVGIPLTLSGAAGLTVLEFTLDYDPSILNGAAIQAGAGLPPTAVLETLANTAGSLRVRLTLSAPLAVDTLVLGHLTGTVASDAPAGATHLLDLTVLSVVGVDGVTDDDGLHVLALPGDVNGDGAYTLADMTLIKQIANGVPPEGEGVFDPALLGDMDGDRDTDLRDTMLAFRASVGKFDASVPALPGTGGAGLLNMKGSFQGFGLAKESGSSVVGLANPVLASDPFAGSGLLASSPFGKSDPFASSRSPIVTPLDTPAPAKAPQSDPFASFTKQSVFANPFGKLPAPAATDPFAKPVIGNTTPANPFRSFRI